MNVSVIVIMIVLGLALGSFINALVWRIYKQSKTKGAGRKKYSILTGRSMCPDCGHKLAPADLVPLFSWLFLRGKCCYCNKPISVQYPAVELITAVLFLLSYLLWPLSFNGEGTFLFVIWLGILVSIIALAIYDIQWLTLPNKIIYLLLGLVIVQIIAIFSFYGGDLHYFLNLLVGLLIGGGVFYLLFILSDGKWIGGGDVKLGGILGLYLGGGMLAVLMIFFASVLGTLYSAPLLVSGKVSRKTLIPYGPFLILATIILRLFGSSITLWLSSRGLSL